MLGKYGAGGDVWGSKPKYRGFKDRDKILDIRKGIRRLPFSEMEELTSESRWVMPKY